MESKPIRTIADLVSIVTKDNIVQVSNEINVFLQVVVDIKESGERVRLKTIHLNINEHGSEIL